MSEYKLNNPLLRQILSFVSVGAVCYFIAILLLMFFVEFAKIEVNLANVLASIITIFICYWLNVKFVFKGGRHSRSKEILAFYIFSFIGLLLNVLLMFLLTEYFPFWYVISKTLVTVIVAIFNFIIRKRFVFLQ